MSDLRWILLIFGVVLILGIYLYGRFSSQLKQTLERQRRNKDEIIPHFGDSANNHAGLDEQRLNDSSSDKLEPFIEDSSMHELPKDSFSTSELPEHVDLELADLTDLIREAVNESKEPFLNNNNTSASEPRSDRDANDGQDIDALIPLINGNIIVINLLPRADNELIGSELLSAFSKLNINFGDMNIFHYVENGQRLFSIANLVEPGTFEPESMLDFATKGISLFMQLGDLIKPVASFERMLEIVWELSNELNADICDIRCEVMTPQTATLLLEAVKHYESKTY